MSATTTKFTATSGSMSLSIRLEALHGAVHLQRRLTRVDKQGGEDVEQDFLFRRKDEFEQWWDQDPNRFVVTQVMEEVKKWVNTHLKD